MSNGRISIIFCGGCNPRIDRGKLAEQARSILHANGYQISYNSADADFIIYLSGCMSSCAEKYNERNRPAVIVAATTMDAVAIDERQIVTGIVMKVKSYFDQLVRD